VFGRRGQEAREQSVGRAAGGVLSRFCERPIHAAAVHGVVLSTEPIDHARIALGRLGPVGKGDERDRRPTQDEIDRIISALDTNIQQQIPVGRIIRFAVATAMRQEEICRVEWSDFDSESGMLLIRDRKDPRKKKGNGQRIPLLNV
jgi:integrase